MTIQLVSAGSAQALRSMDSIVFITTEIDDCASLMAAVAEGVAVHLIDANQDGIVQITQVLRRYSAIQQIHIISHGSPGCLYLGNTQLNLDTLEHYKDELRHWAANSLFLYGCNVAAGDAGTELIERLHQITGTAIAASATPTGYAALGGNWQLEHTLGQTSPPVALDPVVQETYHAVLKQDLNDKDKVSKDERRLSDKLRKLHDQYINNQPLDADLLILDSKKTEVSVRITTSDASQLLPELKKLGFEALGAQNANNLVEGFIPIKELRKLEKLADKGLLGVVPVYAPVTNVGSVTSQADFVLDTERVRTSLPTGYDGTGVRVGVMSDSFNVSGDGSAAADIASGDLPAAGVTVLQEGPSGSSDEGRAMAQLVHDLAPGASLAFSSVFYSEADFAQQIRNLADPTQGNAKVLVDDVIYFAEPFFQDGIIAQAVDDVVTNRGVTYFSSAGNQARQAYESTNVTTGSDSFYAGVFYDFDTGAGVDTRQRITLQPGQTFLASFQWDDPFYTTSGVDSDLDIYLLDAASNVVAGSADDNIANQTPVEIFSYTNTTGSALNLDVLINLFSGPTPTRIKYVNFGDNVTSEYAINGSTISPHAAAVNARAVAAVPYFNQNVPESFTSQGPATILFNPNGTRKATPEVRQKPDFAAIDGTDTTFFGGDAEGNGFPNFFGTSAAAPHAAAIAALIKQANPTFTPAQIYSRMASTAEDLGAAGFDNVTGAGLVNAYRAVFGSVVPAALPFSDGFESGVLSSAYATNASGAGRIRVVNTNGPVGTRHLVLDNSVSSGTIASLNEVTLSLNLSGLSNVQFSFVQKEIGTDADQAMPLTFAGTSNSDGVALSVDGTNWYRLFDLTGANSTSTYQTKSVNLSTFASGNGLMLGSNVRIKFQQYASSSVINTGFAFDSLSVTGDSGGVINGTEGNDTINGTSGSDTINGLGGNDTINGLGGNDTLNGGNGNDIYVFTLDTNQGSDTVNDTVGNNTLTFNNTLQPVNLNLSLTVAQPVNSNLTLTLTAGTLIRTVNGGTKGDNITGNSSGNILNGKGGIDTLVGAGGADRLTGASGNDSLTGGTASDRFSYTGNSVFATSAIGIDTITDFSVGTDKIVLDKTVFNTLTSAAGTGFSVAGEFATVTSDTAAGTSSARITYNTANGKLFYNQDGTTSGFGSGAQFAVLTGNPGLGANDFILQA